MSLSLNIEDTLHIFVFALAVLVTFAWLCVNEVEVTWEYFLLVKDRQNVNIKLPSSPREKKYLPILHWANCWGMEKNKQIRTEVSSQGKYSALRRVYLLNVAYRLFYEYCSDSAREAARFMQQQFSLLWVHKSLSAVKTYILTYSSSATTHKHM